jgi:hypothetical protein
MIDFLTFWDLITQTFGEISRKHFYSFIVYQYELGEQAVNNIFEVKSQN